ncbi:gamma-glutamyl-gamma-aminobutyrate hydrolase family protein [Stenomitos frigidus]|uniref:Peptidase C26 n=1 Tax=Stenomitos frigidus ULC18 TaxID=2107698 RepID=A0A2T1ESC1_9CYAN|nr:gamma-glutamyl-gamma-aminobutyrate hydrolase family protein [Stenomitos frigidus]PSB35548.1 peptidase C26 [Stenomitos frigidus ULC18]
MSEALPVIGITTYSRNEAGEVYLPGAYIDAVMLAGGIPILLPPNQPDPVQLLGLLDGLIFSGGGDIDPQLYGGEHHPSIYLVDPDRDEFEIALATVALTAKIPVLGICRGMQVLSVASGADLITHVPDVYGDMIPHRLDHPRRPIAHDVQVQPNSRLASMLGQNDITVVSWHHQAINTVPNSWTIVAQAADGLPEALEYTHHPWMFAVQWHPELSPDDPVHQRLFQALIKAACKKG